MVSFKSTVCVFAVFSLAVNSLELTQAEADLRCQKAAKYGANYVAKKSATGLWGCELKKVPEPVDTDEPCFDNEYVDPVTHKAGCCVEDTVFSFDVAAQKGACCPSVGGEQFVFQCACGPKEKKLEPAAAPLPPAAAIPPKCPEGNSKTWQTAGKTYKLTCGKTVGGANIGAADPQPDLSICATKCATVPGCKSVDYWNKACYYKTFDKDPIYANGDIDNWVEVPSKPAGLSCPADSGVTKEVNGRTFKLQCGKGISYPSQGPNQPATDLAQCLEKCAAMPTCKGVDFDLPTSVCAFKTASEPTGDFAAWGTWGEVPPPKPVELSCPKDDGATRAIGGQTFSLSCSQTISSPALVPDQPSTSVLQCLEKCSAIPGCKGTDFDLNPTTKCTFKSVGKPVGPSGGTWGTWGVV